MATSKLAQPNISELAANSIRGMILSGQLKEGARVNEVRLASDLGISRPPLREALSKLGTEGALTNNPRQGYFVRALTIGEFEQLYAIRPLLDPEALRIAGLPSPTQMKTLERINTRFSKVTDAASAIALDDQWHMELLAHCPNRILVDLISSIIGRTRRYELALMRETSAVYTASNEHEMILEALRQGDLTSACQCLRLNMLGGAQPIIEWLNVRGACK